MQFFQISKTNVIFFICGILIFSACSSPDYKEAEKTVQDFYTHYKPGDYRVVNKSLLSKDLIAKMEAAALKQSKDAERIKSLGSTDKPFMIEGDVYTSLYEGANHYEIIKTAGETGWTKVEIQFKNSFYNKSWSDTLFLIKEGNSWKIDNVLYTRKQGGAAGTKELFSAFLVL